MAEPAAKNGVEYEIDSPSIKFKVPEGGGPKFFRDFGDGIESRSRGDKETE